MTALFIDGHNFLFKSYGVPFTFKSKKGTQLQVVSTFLSLLRRAIKVTDANQVTVVFDSDAKTDNHELFEGYKANRNYDYSAVEMSPFDHLPLIKTALHAADFTWFEEPGIEADDAVATFSTNFLNSSEGEHSYIASTDTDFLQLVDDKCQILRLLPQGNHEYVTAQSVFDKYMVSPSQYAQLKAWVGDKADNIDGIAGIGWKRGAEIINGTRQRELSDEEKAIYERNLQLIRLNTMLQLEPKISQIEKLMNLTNNDIFDSCDF